MIDATIERQLHEELTGLNVAQQRRVLEYARAMASEKPRGVSGTALLGLIGLIPPDELKLMADAIEEDCGQVNLDEWK